MKVFLNNLKLWHKNKDYIKLGIVLFVILLILELTVFNYKFYSSLGNDPTMVSSVRYNNIVNNGNTLKLGSGDKYIEIPNINKHLNNVYINMEIKDDKEYKENKALNVFISATDAGNSEYFDLPERGIVYNIDQTKYIKLNLNGESEKLKINFIGSDNKEVFIHSIVLNANMPFSFNIIRLIMLFVLISVIYIVKPKSDFYKYKFNPKSNKQNGVLYTVVIINLLIIFTLGLSHPDKGINEVSHHNQYHWLAEAMMDGHFYLNDEPCDTLKALENPYDRRARDNAMKATGERYKWDTAYYNGKYYVYFGVVPELLFFLPTRLMGIFVINKAPVVIMLMIAVIFGYLLIREMTRRWFKDTSFLLYMMVSCLFVNGMGIYLGVKVPDLYMIPISHALAFSLMGVYLWIKAVPDNDDEKGKLNKWYLLLGSICLALVAGCRPQVVFVSFVSVPLLWDHVFKKRELFSAKSVVTTIMFILPYVIVAAFLMYYNYARFGSPFDFGANYNLTVMDMVAEKFNFGKIPLGLYTYFIQPPYFIAVFPFIQAVDIVKDFMGNYVMEQNYGGLFACHIFLLCLVFIYKVKDSLKAKKLWAITLFMVILAFVIAIIDYNTGGLILRYKIDFTWMLFFGAIAVILALNEKYKNTAYENVFYKFMAVSFVWSIFYIFAFIFNEGTATYKTNLPQLYYYMQHLIEFWI